MQSLKGEPRHYAVAVVHGPLPHHPFDSSFPRCFSFPFPSLSFSLTFARSLTRPPSALAARRSCFSYFIGEKASPHRIPYPNGIRHSLDSEPVQ